tara:strand:- start:1468 stop:2241 length:774 start_codon:yes stop_codon:yes gene_type:complete
MDKILVVKIGGNLINNSQILNRFLKSFAKIETKKILIHGGGNQVTKLSKKLNLNVKITNGRRITSIQDLEVATMIYAGSLNKTLVTKLQSFNCNSIGLSGADANLIESVKRPVKEIDYGLVGDIKKINSIFLKNLIDQNLIPVICSITHDKNGQLLNTNADTISSEIAISLTEYYTVDLIYCHEKNGVLSNPNDDNSTFDKLNEKEFNNYLELKIISNGMIPKLTNSFYALNNGVKSVKIAGQSLDEQNMKSTKITN